MYSPQIKPDQVEKLYRLKCALVATGERATMTALVREALKKYLPAKERELKRKLAERGERLLIVDAQPVGKD